MKRWGAPRNSAVFWYLASAIVCLIAAVVWAWNVVQQISGPIEQWPIDLTLFARAWGAILLLWIALWAVGKARYLAALAYEMDRNAIYVLHGNDRFAIPLNQIRAAAPLQAAPPREPQMFVQTWGSITPNHTLIVETAGSRYQLAMLEREQFLRELGERQRLGVIQPVREGPQGIPRRLPEWWARPTIRALAIVVMLLNVALWWVVLWRYPRLPETLPLRFDPIGDTAGTRSKLALLAVPLGASGSAILNSLLALVIGRRSWLASELLLAGALLLHVLLLVAMYFVLTIAV